MKTVAEILDLSTQFFKDKNVERARRTAEDLLGHLLQLKRLDLYLQFDRPLVELELENYRSLIKRKVKGEPLEYVLGSVDFYHCTIQVTPAVLIPRPETEIMLDHICSLLKDAPLEGRVAWDVCTGSGCLGIGLKKACPQLQVSLSDASAEALVVAKKNVELNAVDVDIRKGDLLTPFEGIKADFILCNPPYITSKEYLELDPSVRDFEPQMALVGGDDGLLFYKRLNQELPRFLNSGARVFLEIGFKQKDSLLELFSEPHWKGKKVMQDWAGHDRFFFLEFE